MSVPLRLIWSLDPTEWPRAKQHVDATVATWTAALRDAVQQSLTFYDRHLPGQLALWGWHTPSNHVPRGATAIISLVKRLLGQNGPVAGVIQLPEKSGVIVISRFVSDRPDAASNGRHETSIEKRMHEIDDFFYVNSLFDVPTDQPILLTWKHGACTVVPMPGETLDNSKRERLRELVFARLPKDVETCDRYLSEWNDAFRRELAKAFTGIVRSRFASRTDDTNYAAKQQIRDELVRELDRFDLAITHPVHPALGPCVPTVVADTVGGHYCLVSRINGHRKGFFKSIAELMGSEDFTFQLEPDAPRKERRRRGGLDSQATPGTRRRK